MFIGKIVRGHEYLQEVWIKEELQGCYWESYDNDLHPRRFAEVRPCEWLHTPFLEEAGILQEFTQYATNDGLTDFIADECASTKSSQIYLFKVLLFFLGIILLK